ncbi:MULTISPECIES: L-threonylcarbamoyladenylate synthase [Halobacteriovorax]|uniref:L-threonylcarbamoyladenylate synthase n=1 Tax=Halobacteriovorax TaxID=1652133 RepID=UPI000EB7732E|nr:MULTISPECIES: L-threonylcarbamoyladenylate synthase [Halobacteriovorax]AYF45861.1 putative tRNA threonylcarbamoyl adenosine modification protein, Sua5/YciO/YrdC/YwlC family [Halobacteriovorax sp. BALOs_7]
MIEYVIASNPDDRVLKKVSDALNNGELVCIPTDTNWVVIASPFNKKGVEKIYKYKNAPKLKAFSLLCDSISMASEVAIIEDNIFRFIKRLIPGHFTFIFGASKKITKAVAANKTDHEVGIRFVPSTLVTRLLEVHGEPVLSTNVDLKKFSSSVTSYDEVYSYMIEEELGGVVSMIVDPGELSFAGQSTIVNFTEGGPDIIRQGAGLL